MDEKNTTTAPSGASAGEQKQVPGGEQKPKEKKMIEVDSEVLQSILDQNKEMAQTLTGFQKELKILREAGNRGRIDEAEAKLKPTDKPTCFIKVFQGKPVIGWKSSGQNKLIYSPTNPNQVIGEVLQGTFYFLDDTDSGVVNQVEFTRTEDHLVLEVLDGPEALKDPRVETLKVRALKLVTSDKDLMQSFKMPEGEFTIDKSFINP